MKSDHVWRSLRRTQRARRRRLGRGPQEASVRRRHSDRDIGRVSIGAWFAQLGLAVWMGTVTGCAWRSAEAGPQVETRSVAGAEPGSAPKSSGAVARTVALTHPLLVFESLDVQGRPEVSAVSGDVLRSTPTGWAPVRVTEVLTDGARLEIRPQAHLILTVRGALAAEFLPSIEVRRVELRVRRAGLSHER